MSLRKTGCVQLSSYGTEAKCSICGKTILQKQGRLPPMSNRMFAKALKLFIRNHNDKCKGD